jgi:RNA polymerase sigma-70 factor (ECF subfamily)
MDSAIRKIGDFFTSERQRLVNYVRSLIHDAAERDVEDIVQDVFVSIFSRDDNLLAIEDLSGYVYQSLRNRVIDYFRRNKKMIPLDFSGENDSHSALSNLLFDEKNNSFDKYAEAESRHRVLSAIDSLSAQEKAIIIENEFNGRTFHELSEEWGIPLGTLLSKKSRALVKIKDILEKSET